MDKNVQNSLRYEINEKKLSKMNNTGKFFSLQQILELRVGISYMEVGFIEMSSIY